MKIKQKTIILIITTGILYYALISPDLLPGVTLAVKDAIIISFYVIISSLALRIISVREAKKLKAKIDTQNSQLLAILNSAPCSIYLKTTDGIIKQANNFHSKLTGLDAEKLIGEKASKFFKDIDEEENSDIEVAQKGITIISEKKLETIEGKCVGWYKITKSPVFNEDNKVINILVILQNIDEEKKLEERKNTFIATMTHDLKTPTLAQIRALDLLLNNTFGELKPNQQEIITQIKNSCNYMSNLIFTILDTYMYENGRVKINKDEFNIKELIQETTKEVSNLLIEKEQNIILKSNIHSSTVYCDQIQIKRVLINLIANAISYGNRNTDIVINLDETENSILLNVKNTANYIPEDILKHVFDKYKPTSTQRFKKTSSGLGLYLSKKIIDAHLGKVHAYSSEDGTCIFGFELPKYTKEIITNPVNICTNNKI